MHNFDNDPRHYRHFAYLCELAHDANAMLAHLVAANGYRWTNDALQGASGANEAIRWVNERINLGQAATMTPMKCFAVHINSLQAREACLQNRSDTTRLDRQLPAHH